jgi:hypothetical protein
MFLKRLLYLDKAQTWTPCSLMISQGRSCLIFSPKVDRLFLNSVVVLDTFNLYIVFKSPCILCVRFFNVNYDIALLQCKLRYSEVCDISEAINQVVECTELDHEDEANLQYGGLYERLYIVLDDVIVYQGERGPMGYRMEEDEE